MPNETFDPIFHLAGSLVGEGYGQRLARMGKPAVENVRKTRGQYPGLAGARAR